MKIKCMKFIILILKNYFMSFGDDMASNFSYSLMIIRMQIKNYHSNINHNRYNINKEFRKSTKYEIGI